MTSRTLVAVLAGVLLALVTLVAWSCRMSSPARRATIEHSLTTETDRAINVAPADRAAVRDEPLIRVRVAANTHEAELSSRAYWVIATQGARTGEVIQGPARVIASNRGIKVIDVRGRVHGFSPGDAVHAAIHTSAGPRDEVVLDGVAYPGRLLLVPAPDGDSDAFDVVNVVEIESYLPGVLSRELYSHWHESAFCVQAVAARSFALQRREQARRSGRHFDVESTTRDQAYIGSTSLDVAHRAVDATRGVVLIDAERLAPAYYSSTCGGRPALAEEVWPSGEPRIIATGLTPPAAGKPWRDTLCETAPLYRWETLRDSKDLTQRIEAWARAQGRGDLANLGAIESVVVSEFGASGRPITYEIRGRNGLTAEITGEQLRIAANFETDALGPVDRRTRFHSNDLEIEIGRLVTRVRGRGHGHGVGLCQFCAQGMALRGDSWRQMLAEFYPGVEVRRVY